MDQPGRDAAPTRVLIADDQALFRRGLQAVLAAEPDLDVVAVAGSGSEAVDLAVAHVPDVVLMDVGRSRVNGLEVTRQLRRLTPSVKVLILAADDDGTDAASALQAGAAGYLRKDIAVEELTSAIRALGSGRLPLAPARALHLLDRLGEPAPVSQAGPVTLTDRELQVLRLVAEGRNNRDIAGELFISENTVKNHVRNILDKLQLHSRTQAVVYAVREKLVEIR